MSRIKEILEKKQYLKWSFFIAFTASLLFILYLLISNFSAVISTVFHVFLSLSKAFAPLTIGLILAYLLGPAVEFINTKFMTKLVTVNNPDPIKEERLRSRIRTLSILVTFFLIFTALGAVLYGFTALVVGQMSYSSSGDLTDTLIRYFDECQRMVNDLLKQLSESGLEEKIQELIGSVIGWFSSHFNAKAAIEYITGVGISIVNILLGVVVSIYVLKDKDFFSRLWRKTLHLVFPMDKRAVVSETLGEIDGIIAKFIRGQLLDSLIIAILSSLALSLIGLDFAVFIGCFAGIANVIPYFGPFMGMVPAVAVGLLTGGLRQGLTALAVLFVIQQLDASVISPKVVGTSIGLHPVFVLVAVTAGGYYFGIPGMLLAVPVAAILKLFLMKKLESVE